MHCEPQSGLTRNLLQHLVRVGVLTGFFLGRDKFTAEGDFVDASTGRDQCDLLDGVVVVVKNLFRQTGGFCEISSRGAVLDGDLALVSHDNS